MRQRQRSFFTFFPAISFVLCSADHITAEQHLTVTSQEPIPVTTLSAFPLHLEQIGDTLVMPMSLGGFAWVEEVAPQEWRTTEKPDWPTLSITPLSDDLFLLGGRDGTMRFVEKGDPGDEFLTLARSQPSEGQFFALDYQSGILAAASGGAGASFWEISKEQKSATLLGRYPFPTFARDVQWVNDDHVVLADAHDLGIILLDLSDPKNPREVSTTPLQRGFCDAFTFSENQLLTHNRLSHVFLFESPDGFQAIDYSNRAFLYDYLPTKEPLRIADIGHHDGLFFLLDQVQGLYTVAPPSNGRDWEVRPVVKTLEALNTFTVDENKNRIYLGSVTGEISMLDYSLD